MPEGFIQVAPDSTGPKIRTRERTIGANTVEEQYAILLGSDRVVSSRVWYSSFRVPNRASTSQPMFSMFNTGTNPVSCRRLSVECDSNSPFTAASPWLRLYRVTAAPTNGSVVTGVQQDTGDAAINAGVVVRADHQGDGASATTALAATPNPTSQMWAQTVPRLATSAGWVSPPVLSMVPDDGALQQEDPLILRTNQGFVVRFEAAAAPTANFWFFMFKAVLGEFTTP